MVDGSHMQNTDCVISKPLNIYGENCYANYKIVKYTVMSRT